jgi:hypothetical protein
MIYYKDFLSIMDRPNIDDAKKTKDQLTEEVEILRQRIAALEITEAWHAWAAEVLQQLRTLKAYFINDLQAKKTLCTAEHQPQNLSLTPGGTVMIRPGWYLHWCKHCLEPFRSKEPDPKQCGRRGCRKKGWRKERPL